MSDVATGVGRRSRAGLAHLRVHTRVGIDEHAREAVRRPRIHDLEVGDRREAELRERLELAAEAVGVDPRVIGGPRRHELDPVGHADGHGAADAPELGDHEQRAGGERGQRSRERPDDGRGDGCDQCDANEQRVEDARWAHRSVYRWAGANT